MLSIIIPCFNEEKVIYRSIEKILDWSDKNNLIIELVINGTIFSNAISFNLSTGKVGLFSKIVLHNFLIIYYGFELYIGNFGIFLRKIIFNLLILGKMGKIFK